MTFRITSTMKVVVASVVLAGASASAQIRAKYGSVVQDFETTRIAGGVYAFLPPDSKTPFVSGNSLVVIGHDRALVVDTGHVPAVTRRMIAEIKRLTNVPVAYAVNTHWHFDHIIGNGEYEAAFRGVAIISTASTRSHIEAQVPGYPAQMTSQVTAGLAAIRQLLKDGRKKDGSPLSADDREFFEAEIRDFESAAPAVREMTYAAPTLTVDRELTVDLGKRAVRILFLGRGNTAGDAIVYVPDTKVVATGDLVVAPVPYATAPFMFEWPVTMRKLMALEVDSILPGHGPIMHDWTFARRVVDLIEAVNAQVKKAVADDLSLDETRKRVDVASYRKELAGDDPFQRRIFDTFFQPGAVQRAYDEARFLSEK
jgi:cyclase